MYCRKCGIELRSTDVFCSNCGTQVNQEASADDRERVGGSSGGTEEEHSTSITHNEELSTYSEAVCDIDPYFVEAGRLIIRNGKASIGMLQRQFKLGFNKAVRLMDQLQEAGVVGDENGTDSRKVLMTMEEFESYRNRCGIPIIDKNKEDEKTDEKTKQKYFTIAWWIGSVLIVRLLGGTLFDSFLLAMLGNLIFRYVFRNKEK